MLIDEVYNAVAPHDTASTLSQRQELSVQHFFKSIVTASGLVLAPLLSADDLNADDSIRVASFNSSLNRSQQGELTADLRTDDAQAKRVATILRITQPDILLLNEFDYEESGEAIQLFRSHYLENSSDTAPLILPYAFSAAVNTGLPSSMDLDHDGKADGPGDAFGFGRFPGQYGMAVLSKFPVDAAKVQTFQKLLWSHLPKAQRPVDPRNGQPWYSDRVWNQLRLSSKSHWVVPISVNGRALNLVVSHPTPPAFDGPEDRNGCRNHDEIELVRHIISGNQPAWLKSDNGEQGGLSADAPFVVCGDLNSDPADGGSKAAAIRRLLSHRRVRKVQPTSKGAIEAAARQKGANRFHKGDSRFDTADFSDKNVGNLRVDYCLPSCNFRVIDSGVFWPSKSEKHANLLNCSDHRLVWADIEFID